MYNVITKFKVFHNFQQILNGTSITCACTSDHKCSSRTSFSRINNQPWNKYRYTYHCEYSHSWVRVRVSVCRL